MTMGSFLAACLNGNPSHSFCHVQFDHHCGGIHVPLQSDILEDIEVLCLYDVIRFDGYDPVLCVLSLLRSQEMDWSRYGGDDTPVFGYDFRREQVYDVPTLRANKRSRNGSGVVIDISGYVGRWLQDIQFQNIRSCEAEWLEFGGVSGSGGGPGVVVADPPVLGDLELLFKRDAGWTRDVDAARPELHKQWGLLRDEPPSLQMTAPTDILGIVKFGREIVEKNKVLVEEVKALQIKVTVEKAAAKGVEEEFPG